MKTKLLPIIALLMFSVAVSACTKDQMGIVGGAAAGGIVGGAVSGSGTGAVVGAVGGGLLGHEAAKHNWF